MGPGRIQEGGGGGGGARNAEDASFVWGHAPREIFQNLSRKNGHFQHFKTNFLLV